MPVTVMPTPSYQINVTAQSAPVIVTPVPANEIGVTREASTVVVEGDGMQGPQGEPGAGGDSVAIVRVAQNAIGGHRIVRAVVGEVDIATAMDAAHGDDLLGITTHAAVQGAPVQVLTSGAITEPSWSWTPGEPLFLGENGLMTHTPPADPAFEVTVGFAETPTTVFLSIGTPIYY